MNFTDSGIRKSLSEWYGVWKAFAFFCNTKPFSAKAMLLIFFSAMIKVYVNNFMYIVLLISWAVTKLISYTVIELLKFLSLRIPSGRKPVHWSYHIFMYFDNSRSAYAILHASTFFSFVLLSRSRFQKESERDASSVPTSQLGIQI